MEEMYMGMFDYHNVLWINFIADEIECAPKEKKLEKTKEKIQQL